MESDAVADLGLQGFSDSPYPGGKGAEANSSYHVPACDWYDNGTAPRCSGFYHDQEQTPEHPGGGNPYPVDGNCIEQCDCGSTNPCGEYIFDHRGGEVEGRTFRDWFINEYMVTNETLFHKDPVTGRPQVIGLGWLDDSMGASGPSEEDTRYIPDTGASPKDMYEQVVAYQESMYQLIKKVVPLGGFWWQLMDNGGMQLNQPRTSPARTVAECKTILRARCIPAAVGNSSATPGQWKRMQMYNMAFGDGEYAPQNMTDYTAEFLLTRGPYAMLGYSWCGCTTGDQARTRAAEWDDDFGEPAEVCKETGADTGVFTREWTGATVAWDCNASPGAPHGRIARKAL